MIEENGPIENIQVFVCLLSFVVFLIGANAQLVKANLHQLSASLFLSLIPLAGAGRELSFGAVLGIEGSNLLYTKYALAAFASIVAFSSLAAAVVAYRNRALNWARALHGYAFFLFAFASIVLAQLLEKGQLGLPKNQNLEEAFELLGYVLLACLSFFRLKTQNLK